ncbi:MAG TPA: hypothetical protein VNU01_00220, partial [Egibacteraceae bacterium]|nr:hypothetical protein [Egibacteraceae bacterium]
MSARGGAAAPLLALLGGLAVAAGGAGTWVVRTSVRDVGGVPLRQADAVPGTAFAPLALPAGLLLILVALVALALRGTLPRVAAGALLAAAFGAVAVVADGIVRASVAEGRLGAAPWAAAAGAVLA